MKQLLAVLMIAAFAITVSTPNADARRGGYHGRHIGSHHGFHGRRHYGGRHFRYRAPRYYGRHYYKPYRRYAPYVAIPAIPYVGTYIRPYNGGCGWIKMRAARTGSEHWWRKYYNCMDYYGH